MRKTIWREHRHPGAIAGATLLAATLLLSGCLLVPQTQVPMPTLWDEAETSSHQQLLVFLPGLHDRARDFEDKGFFALARQYGLRDDLVAADAHIGYLLDGNFIERFRRDIIVPAKQEGYQSIWLVGISLGGFSSLLYYTTYPADIDGVLLFSPFLGQEQDLKAIHGAGGPLQWRAQTNGVTESTFQLWRRLQRLYDRRRLDKVFLAFGTEDRFAHWNSMLGQMLPASNIYRAPGDHDWQTWRGLWTQILAHNRLALFVDRNRTGARGVGPPERLSQ